MNRLVTGALSAAALLASAVLLTGPADAAPAQDVPLPPECQLEPPTYPPTPPPPLEPAHKVASGSFDPGGPATLTVTGAQSGITYCGVVYSVPFYVGQATANASGVMVFGTTSVPADFQLDVLHRLDVYRRGFLVSSTPFCVADPDDNGIGVVADFSQCTPVTSGSTTTTPGGGGTTTTNPGGGGTTTTNPGGGGTTTTNPGGGGTTTTKPGTSGSTSTTKVGSTTGGSTTGGSTTGGSTGGATTGGTANVGGTNTGKKGSLPLTGFEMLVLLQIAGVSIGLGAYLRYLRHKRAIGVSA